MDKPMTPVGAEVPAEDIPSGRNMQLFTEAEDLQWVRDVHGATNDVTGAILFGNEDAPDAVWVTASADPNNLRTVYRRIA